MYSAAVDVGIEPNIIIEFARIYGFEIDFQRDLRKGDTFEIYTEVLSWKRGIAKGVGRGLTNGEVACQADMTITIPEILETYLPK